MKTTKILKGLLGIMLLWQLVGRMNVLAAPLDNAYYFSTLSLKDGLSQLSVLDIYQDSKGFIWLGTRNGLNKYDGNHMTVYKHLNNDSLSLVDNHISALVEDRKQHHLWVGTARGLSRIDLTTDRITPYSGRKFPWLNSGVGALFVDSMDRLWVGTSHGLYLFVQETETFQQIDLNGKIVDVPIPDIIETFDHRLLIATDGKGIYACNMSLKQVEHYGTEDGVLNSNSITDLHEDSNKRLWVSTTNGGLSKVDLTNGTSVHYTAANSELTTDDIRCVGESDGTLFVGTFDGLYTIDLGSNRMNGRFTAALEKGALSHFSIYSVCVDNGGGVWVGTYSGGANYFSRYNNRFTFHEPANAFNMLMGIYGAMTCRAPHCLYIATEGGGLLDYHLETGTYQYYLYDTSSAPRHSRNIIKSVTLDGENVWCGTAQGSVYQFDTRSKRFSLYYTLPMSEKIPIYAIVHGQDSCLWMATSRPALGLVKLTKDKQAQTRFELAGDGKEWKPGSLRCLLELRPGVLLLGSRNNGLYRYDDNRRECTTYSKEKEGNLHLPSDYVTSIVRTSSGQIWIGTFGGGLSLYDEEKGIVKNITAEQGLTDVDVCMVVEDTKGDLWISTNNNIFKYDTVTEEVHNYLSGSGIGVQEFTPHSGMLLPDGRICFSASNGFVTFHPSDLQINSFMPPLVFTSLVVNNKTITPSDNDILKVTLDDTEKVVLNYDQNNIAIGYCALNYVYAYQNQYAYRLQGHDEEWNHVGNRREAYYTSLEPGNYVFEVKAANNDGVWSDQTRTLRIIVRPPLWKTWYAYLFYIVSFFGICFLILYYVVKKKELEQQLFYEHLKQQQAEDFHQAKIRMFTNFSHELRTPLTLIVTPLQELLQHTDFTAAVRNKISLIYNNAQRLLLLVNQLMDLRKNQDGKMQLKIVKEDVCSFLQEIYSAFNQIALSKGIHFVYDCKEDRIPAWFDKSLFEKVVFNLLSNAFKYTHEGGGVTLSVGRIKPEDIAAEHREDWMDMPEEGTALICLSVSDTGQGIPEEEMKNIFTPFYQIEEGKPKEVAGTGIGLSLTQSIVQLHHGIIWVENNEKGGALFRVVIPIDRAVYTEDEIDRTAADRVVIDVIPSTISPESLHLEKKYTILLAEDHEEVRAYIKECLEPYFQVLEAGDGEQAFEMVVDKFPDLVVSDIMMPRKDGLELCTEIKQDMRTGHIPVILMTARSMVMHIKEGFLSGADDYIVKPFNMDVLIYRIQNILVSREKLRSLYGKKFSPEAIGLEKASGDDRFTQSFFEVIEQNISNPKLNIDLICREVGLSRTNLYRKLKAITDLSPVELIRNKRLEVAAKLLLESDYSVSEVSTYSGFNSYAYFTQCFKQMYGCAPSEFLSSNKK